MASYYTLQSGGGVLVLEDGSGNLLLQSDAGGAAAGLSVHLAGTGGLAGRGGLAGPGGGICAVSQDDTVKKAREA